MLLVASIIGFSVIGVCVVFMIYAIINHKTFNTLYRRYFIGISITMMIIIAVSVLVQLSSKQYEPIAIGNKYLINFSDPKDPFSSPNLLEYTVLDMKDGFLKLEVKASGVSYTTSKKQSSFEDFIQYSGVKE